MYRIRRAPWPSRVTFPPPSMTTSGLLLNTRAVAAILIVTGSGPQSNVITPPAATALTTACEVQLAGVPRPTTWSGLELSAGPAPAGMEAVPPGLPGSGWAGVTRVTPMTFARKPAVSPRVMARPGQYLPSPQPTARPAVASRLMAVANRVLVLTSRYGIRPVAVSARARLMYDAIRPRLTFASGQNRFLSHGVAMPAVTTLSTTVVLLLGTSRKRTPLVFVRRSARTRKTAMSPRVTSVPGQNRLFAGGLQGFMIPAAATVSIALSNREPSSSRKRPSADTGAGAAIASRTAQESRISRRRLELGTRRPYDGTAAGSTAHPYPGRPGAWVSPRCSRSLRRRDHLEAAPNTRGRLRRLTCTLDRPVTGRRPHRSRRARARAWPVTACPPARRGSTCRGSRAARRWRPSPAADRWPAP